MGLKQNTALRIAIVQSGKKQKTIARLARISQAQLSHVIRGRREATEDEKARIARVIDRAVDELFPEQVAS